MDHFNPAYTRYHAQFQRLHRNILHSSQDDNPPPLPVDDGSLMINVRSKKLDRATGQSFYIIDTQSRHLPDPIIYLTGAYGNLYKVSFTSTDITCSCGDSYNPCKHILHILSLIRCQLNHGWVAIYPIQVITLIHSNILHQHLLGPDSSRLFSHEPNHKCWLCNHIIHSKANYFVCPDCASVSHKSCTPTPTHQCCPITNRQPPLSLLPVSISGKHRNFYFVLVHLRLHVKKPPGINYYTNSRRYPPILLQNRRRQNLQNPPPPPILHPQQPQQQQPAPQQQPSHVIPESPQASSANESSLRRHV